MHFVHLLLKDLVDLLPESISKHKPHIEALVTLCHENLEGKFKTYNYNLTTADCVARIRKQVQDQRESLANDDPNSLEDEIVKKAIKINKPAKVTFESKSSSNLRREEYHGPPHTASQGRQTRSVRFDLQ